MLAAYRQEVSLRLSRDPKIQLYIISVSSEMKKGIFFRLTEEEFAVIEGYCLDTGRSKSDVLRELVRKLKNKKTAKNIGARITA